MKILNAYSGIGANTHNWDRELHDITHVEINEEIAEVNKQLHPEDTVIIGDAKEHLEQKHREYDYIWASPPCSSHSSIRKAGAKNGQYQPKLPDMDLYGLIIFLEEYFTGNWAVENVKPYYEPLIERKMQQCGRHLVWSNHPVPKVQIEVQRVNQRNNTELAEWLGIEELTQYKFESVEKRKVLRNCVHPKIGEKILQARKTRQVTLTE